MKKQQQKTTYFFVDESGDPYFYDRKGNLIIGKEGCSKLLILGFIKTEVPELLRQAILKVRNDLSIDTYLEKIPSLIKSLKYFHATDDTPEVREKVSLIADIYDYSDDKNTYYTRRNIFDLKKISPL